jgi:hypothetical protein
VPGGLAAWVAQRERAEVPAVGLLEVVPVAGRKLPVLVGGKVEVDRCQRRRQRGRRGQRGKPPPAGCGCPTGQPLHHARLKSHGGLPGRGQQQQFVGHLGQLCNVPSAAAAAGQVLQRLGSLLPG